MCEYKPGAFGIILVHPYCGKLKGNIENILTDTEAGIYKRYGITYSKLRVKRENYDLVVTTNQDQSFNIWES